MNAQPKKHREEIAPEYASLHGMRKGEPEQETHYIFSVLPAGTVQVTTRYQSRNDWGLCNVFSSRDTFSRQRARELYRKLSREHWNAYTPHESER